MPMRGKRSYAARKTTKLYKQPALKPDGMYKEKVKFVLDILVRVPGVGSAPSAFLNVHHTYPLQSSSGTTVPGNVHFNADNLQFQQVASLFQKYAVYGVAIKIIPKNFFPDATN